MNAQVVLYKLRHLVLPLILLSAAYVVCYSALNWFLVMGSGLVPLDEDVAAYWLPAFGAIVAVLILIQPRLRELNISANGNIQVIGTFIAIAVVALPAVVAQSYVREAGAKLVTAPDAASIATLPPAKFYATRTVCLDRARGVAHTDVSSGGSRDEYLDIDLFVAVPLCHDTSSRIWFGFKFQVRLDGNATEAANDAAYAAFVHASEKTLNATDPAAFRYFERVGVNTDRRNYEKALHEAKIAVPAPIFLLPHRNNFAPPKSRLTLTLVAFAAAALVWLLLVLFTPLRPPEPHAPFRAAWWRPFVIPDRSFYGLPLLLDLNVLVYLVMVFAGLGVVSFAADDLKLWGGNYGAALHGLGWLRLITCQFVHVGAFHIAANMYGLLFASAFLTPVAQNARLIALYLICGLGGSIASVVMHPDVVSVGASGAIFGLCGVLVALLSLRDPRMADFGRPVLANIGVFVAFNLIYGAATPGIDNAAHIGGLATGLVCGATLRLLDRGKLPPGEFEPAPH